ncbi:hypothetical protein R9X50_00423200 [Acrodontium crateriforme]|uniref:FAD/NAD(P)-binding domain-containing protein n=1 Tax=Acrodontium crateriforme TaxID=150365 RepID=A0AAQ3M5P6_9PEZI|nr:hypothetical protein R9X50_00423200 [Acrodontium crateriforme]
MKPSSLFSLPFLFAAANAAPTLAPAVYADYDAIVVGGGPAGLAATSGLARVRRNVLMVDSGEYRNDPTRHAHDILGFDGVTPAWLRFAARKQIEDYGTATLVNGTVTKIEPQNNNTSFNVSITYPGNKPVTFITRKVVLGTGMKDDLPATPGIVENWGKGIYWCPWCDGHEHADQSLGIVGPLDQGATTVREILTLNQDVVVLVNGTDTADRRATTDKKFPGWEKYLQLHNIKVENRTISSIVRIRNGTDGSEDPSLPTHAEHDLFQVNFESGAPLLRNAFLTNFAEEQKSKLGQQTGVALYGTKLAADNSMGLVTNVPGIFAIGDCNSDNVTNVPHAMFTGKRTAVFLHVALERENSVAQLAQAGNKKRENNEAELRSIWERMNPLGDVLHAGDFKN